MAEFQEVMRQWGRLCRQHCAERADDCDGCILGGMRADVCSSYPKDNEEDCETIERLVMEWAAEHPVPVYPTWGEWLSTMGLTFCAKYNGVKVYFQRDNKIAEHIPAVIAEKLGIAPKEG